ncbi:MAG TPA: L-fucokinase [Verrucomicrobiota bacterium]|jgi:fucokinase|nr:L-fucokinase [Verrucomicrobiota bacterium]
MNVNQKAWNWLVVTASNDLQAAAYRSLLKSREGSALLASFERWQVIPDPAGQRVGSGGSTVFCLLEIASKVMQEVLFPVDSWEKLEELLGSQRVMIIHAGGDSRRLPAYAPCGKLFVPIPNCHGGVVETSGYSFSLFDRLLSDLVQLPVGKEGRGQYLVVSGDTLLLYNPNEVRFDFSGLTAVGVRRPLNECLRHGVLCADADARVRLYLQKPTRQLMESSGALLNSNEGLLDAGLMSFDTRFAIKLMQSLGVEFASGKRLKWNNSFLSRTMEKGLDFYREICCALGTDSSLERYLHSVRQSGSFWPEAELESLYCGLEDLPFYYQIVSWCDFLHFGASAQLISSAQSLVKWNSRTKEEVKREFVINSRVLSSGMLMGKSYWIEGCQIEDRLLLEGENVLTGITFQKAQRFPRSCCLDISEGVQPNGSSCWFIRPYGINDSFKESLKGKGTFCNLLLKEWLSKSGIDPEWIWDNIEEEEKCTLWNARFFPALENPSNYQDWLWYYAPEKARNNPSLVDRFLNTPRYDCSTMARLVDLDKFYARRLALNCSGVGRITDKKQNEK